MVDIFQTTFSSAFYWKKMFQLRLKLYWGLLLRVQSTIFQHFFQIMAWRRPSNKPLSETMMVRLPTNKFQRNLNRNSKHFHWWKTFKKSSAEFCWFCLSIGRTCRQPSFLFDRNLARLPPAGLLSIPSVHCSRQPLMAPLINCNQLGPLKFLKR